ncbi:hypothetical protein [Spiroplasma endosymbiont of Othius punctulatus]|uniref:hypothetical protein n=1 Tax=Spiroplasma endosymbiont of Othius punctulatus TaxID=3066289 RepID=UPI0030CCC10A
MFNKFNNKKRRIVGFSILASTLVFGMTSTLMVAPGIGVESLMFITSVKKELQEITPKGKFVLDKNSPAYSIVKNVIKKSFVADAISTIDHNNEEELKMKIIYEEYALNWFDDHFGEEKDIDLYDVGNSLIEFDKSVAGKFHSFGFVNPGISWVFSLEGLSEIYSSEIYDLSLKQQTLYDQEEYEYYIEDNGIIGNTVGIEVTYSKGTNIVNNKVWFLNKQIETIQAALTLHVTSGALGIKIFKDEKNELSLNDSIFDKHVTTDDLYHPNFTSTLTLLRIAIVFFALSVAIVPAGVIVSHLTLKNTSREKKIKNNPEN